MKELICIVCPKGCHLQVDETKGYAVEGNGCARGVEYGKNELINPVRVLASVVKIEGALHACCPVKTNGAIPKEKIFACMESLRSVHLQAPVKAGEIVMKNVCETGIDWITCKEM